MVLVGEGQSNQWLIEESLITCLHQLQGQKAVKSLLPMVVDPLLVIKLSLYSRNFVNSILFSQVVSTITTA